MVVCKLSVMDVLANVEKNSQYRQDIFTEGLPP